MGYSGRGKKTIGANIDIPLADYIEARAVRLDKTVSWAGARIIQFWIAHGAPPLSEADENMPALTLAAFLRENTTAKDEPTETSEDYFTRRLREEDKLSSAAEGAAAAAKKQKAKKRSHS